MVVIGLKRWTTVSFMFFIRSSAEMRGTYRTQPKHISKLPLNILYTEPYDDCVEFFTFHMCKRQSHGSSQILIFFFLLFLYFLNLSVDHSFVLQMRLLSIYEIDRIKWLFSLTFHLNAIYKHLSGSAAIFI